MEEIKGVFFDLGGTLRIAEHVPEHEARAAARMAELAGARDVEAIWWSAGMSPTGNGP